MLVTYFGCFPHFRQSGDTGFLTGSDFSMLHKMPESPCGRVKYYRGARHPELNSPGNVLIGALSALFGEAQ